MIHRRNMPDKLVINGKTFKLNVDASHTKRAPIGVRYRKVSILSKRLEEATDLRGNKYKPSVFIFTEST